MPRPVKMAAVQMHLEPAPAPQRLERAGTLVAQAAGRGAHLVVLPEFFNTGYEYSDENYKRAERLDGPTVTWMKQTAARHGLHLAGTLLLLDPGGEDIYNAMLLVAPDGRTWRYDKNYPWMWERPYFRDGQAITVAETSLGHLGMLICWDAAHPDLWARYAGKVEAMVVCSCPPAMHDLTWIFPDGTRMTSEQAGPIMRHIKRTSGEVFGNDLRRQSAYLGVPVVNTTGAGTFFSAVPSPRLSLAIYVLLRPDLWKYIPHAAAARIEADSQHQTYIADAAGRVLDQVPPGVEGYALAEVTLPDRNTLPQPRGAPPHPDASRLAYAFDTFANVVLAPVYRQKARRAYGQHMAPVTRSTRLWLGGLVLAGLAGYGLGRLAGPRRR